MKDNQKILFAWALISLLTIVLLAVAHSLKASFLSIESRWLLVSGIPLLIALFAGGYIKRFKGLVVELEVELQRSVEQGYVPEAPEMLLEASDIAEREDVVAKESLERLYAMPTEKKRRVKRLSFVTQRQYFPNVNEEYFQSFPEFAFLEVRDQSGAIVCILPRKAIGETNMQTFSDSLLRGIVAQEFADAIVDKPVRAGDSFLVAIEKLRNSGLESLPVIDKSRVVSLVDRSSAFERLAEGIGSSWHRSLPPTELRRATLFELMPTGTYCEMTSVSCEALRR